MTVVIKPKIGQQTPSTGGVKTDGTLAGSSFHLVERKTKRRLIMSIQGAPGKGKTHLSLTAPAPIAYMNFDFGTEGVVDKPEFRDKEIHLADYHLDFPYTQPAAKAVYDQFVTDYKAALGSTVARTLVIDTATEGWEVIRLAKLGKLQNIMPIMYAPVNREYQELIRKAYYSDVNLILIHKQKKSYVNEQWDGKYERAGFADTGYLVQVEVEAYKEDGVYKVRVVKSRQNPGIEGQVIDNPTFAKLGMAVFPDSKEEDWK